MVKFATDFPSYCPTPIPTLFTEDKLFVSDLLLLEKKHQHKQHMYMSPCTASQSPIAGLWSQRVNDCSSVSFVWPASMGCLMVRAHLPGTKHYLFLPDLSTSLLSNVWISANPKSEKRHFSLVWFYVLEVCEFDHLFQTPCFQSLPSPVYY